MNDQNTNPSDENQKLKPKSIQSKGGDARAKSLTPEERSEIARAAAHAKHEKSGDSPPMPRATHEGKLEVGDMEIACAVLDNQDGLRIRVLSQGDFLEALGRHRKANVRKEEGEEQLPAILQGKAINPFITKDLIEKSRPIVFRTVEGVKASGYRAELLPEVCEVYLKARDAGVLPKNQQHVAVQAEILVRALAKLGVIAWVDEATGYQYDRPRKDLEQQLKQFLSEDLRRYVETFPAEYFKQLCRLRGVEMRPDMRLPQYFGKLTNNLVYRRIAPGLLKKLKERRGERGRKSNKIFQWMSEDVGVRALLLHLGSVIGFMKSHTNYEAFQKQLDVVYPIYPELPGLFDNPKDWEAPE
jgi:hypothetical protein